jgi:hypothetical protein
LSGFQLGRRKGLVGHVLELIISIFEIKAFHTEFERGFSIDNTIFEVKIMVIHSTVKRVGKVGFSVIPVLTGLGFLFPRNEKIFFIRTNLCTRAMVMNIYFSHSLFYHFHGIFIIVLLIHIFSKGKVHKIRVEFGLFYVSWIKWLLLWKTVEILGIPIVFNLAFLFYFYIWYKRRYMILHVVPIYPFEKRVSFYFICSIQT